MIFRGTDTVAILMEWIMARMALHPDIQAKAQAELDAVMGRGRGVADADVGNLPYIQCIVKLYLAIWPEARWPGPRPDVSARPRHGTPRWLAGLGWPGPTLGPCLGLTFGTTCRPGPA